MKAMNLMMGVMKYTFIVLWCLSTIVDIWLIAEYGRVVGIDVIFSNVINTIVSGVILLITYIGFRVYENYLEETNYFGEED